MVNNGEGDKGLICATRHLTIFSAILQQLQCLNIQVLWIFRRFRGKDDEGSVMEASQGG